MVDPEEIFPYATGTYIFAAFAVALQLYRRSGFKPVLIFAAGALAVAIQSFLDGYQSTQLLRLAGGEWNEVPKVAPEKLNYLLLVDAVRGVFILLWAAAEVMFAAALAGATRRLVTTYIPVAIVVLGGIVTFAVNFSDIQPIDRRILISSALRVLPILVPVSLVAGFYILLKLWRPTRSPSLLLISLGFILHGATLPFYSFAKAQGSIALGLWYAFGGLIPVTAFLLGLYLAVEEARAARGGG